MVGKAGEKILWEKDFWGWRRGAKIERPAQLGVYGREAGAGILTAEARRGQKRGAERPQVFPPWFVLRKYYGPGGELLAGRAEFRAVYSLDLTKLQVERLVEHELASLLR